MLRSIYNFNFELNLFSFIYLNFFPIQIMRKIVNTILIVLLSESNSYQPGRLFFHYVLCPQNLLSPTIRDLKMLERSGFHQNVDLSSLLSKFISDFENPSRKTRERNYKHCVRLFERTIKASNLRLAAKCRHQLPLEVFYFIF